MLSGLALAVVAATSPCPNSMQFKFDLTAPYAKIQVGDQPVLIGSGNWTVYRALDQDDSMYEFISDETLQLYTVCRFTLP